MPNFESITICGHLGGNAEMKETSAGHVTEFRVAVNYGKKDDKKTTWYSVSCWHEVAKGCEHLRKGDGVVCVGKMRCRKYEKDGVTHYYWSLVADVVGKALYVKDEPGYGKDVDYHEPEPVDDNSDIPF